MSTTKPLRVAMVGHGFMGAAHSQAFRVAPRFLNLPLPVEMAVLVGRDPGRTQAAAEQWGWAEAATNWRAVVERDDIDLVDIVTPGDTHHDIAIAALAAGKHVMCEKPLANSVAEAEAMAAAAAQARAKGVRSMVGFSYRRVPAAIVARDLIAAGRLGDIRQIRATYLQDWLTDPEVPLVWRLQREAAGSGALGDIGAHAIDMAQFMTGQVLTTVSGMLETFVTERPLVGETVGLGGTAAAERGTVTVDDLALFHARFSGGAVGSFEATRFATGRKNAFRIEIAGSLGALSFDMEDMNVLWLYEESAPAGERGFRRIIVTEPEHPYMAQWWPTGHFIGYEHSFSHQVKDFVTAIAEGTDPWPSFDEGLQIQRVLAAVEESAASGSGWVAVG